MADIQLDNEALPLVNPASSSSFLFVDSTSKRLTQMTDAGIRNSLGLVNASIAVVSGAYAADTYLAGSNLVVAAGAWQAGTSYYCMFDMTKTAAGTAAFTITLRLGTLGTTGDSTGTVALAFTAGSAAVDTGIFEVWATFRSVGGGTAAVVQAAAACGHNLAATGLIGLGTAGYGALVNTSSGFNSLTPTTIGISVNGGGSFSGTNTFVQSQLLGV